MKKHWWRRETQSERFARLGRVVAAGLEAGLRDFSSIANIERQKPCDYCDYEPVDAPTGFYGRGIEQMQEGEFYPANYCPNCGRKLKEDK